MGHLGFYFKINFENKLTKKDLIIFIETNKFEEIIILGNQEKFDINNCNYYFLTKKLSLSKYILASNFKYKYSKIRTAQKNMQSFEDFFFWFNGKTYREVYNLFEIKKTNFLEMELIKKVDLLINYFK